MSLSLPRSRFPKSFKFDDGANDAIGQQFLIGRWTSGSSSQQNEIVFCSDQTGTSVGEPPESIANMPHQFRWRTTFYAFAHMHMLKIEAANGGEMSTWFDYGNDSDLCRIGKLGLYRRSAPAAKTKSLQDPEPGTLNSKR